MLYGIVTFGLIHWLSPQTRRTMEIGPLDKLPSAGLVDVESMADNYAMLFTLCRVKLGELEVGQDGIV